MYCPICRFRETRVIDSRVTPDGFTIRRRRECGKCHYRFSTTEEMEVLDLTVVKRDGRHETYSREKLMSGIRRSLTKRSHTQEAFDRLLHQIERDIQKKKKSELTSREIGEVVMKHLSKFDTVAYIRFASIYRAFQDVEKFQTEIRSLRRLKNRP